MIDIVNKHRFYFTAYFVFFVALFIFILNTDELAATLYFSNHRTEGGDFFFKWITRLGEEYVFIGLTLYFLFINKNIFFAQKIAISGLFIMIPIFLFKTYFSFDRPATIIESMGILPEIHFVAGVELLKGATSFPSGHTAGAFVAWTLLAFKFGNHKLPLQLLCLTTAILVGVSRVYLVQHFPQDVLFGSSIGMASAWFLEYLFEKLGKKNSAVRA
jgi:membrane-associated phospholipid phosphatase